MVTGEARRRWTTERAVLEQLESLNDLSMDSAQEFAALGQVSAGAEADHKRLRARAILTAQARARGESQRVSVAQAETVAEASDEVSSAYWIRLTSAAHTEGVRERLRTIRENQQGLRTAAASLRTPYAGPGMQ